MKVGERLRTIFRTIMLLIVTVTIYMIFTTNGKDELDQPLDLKDHEVEYKDKVSVSISQLIGLTEDQILNQYGEPTRIDPSYYDYNWWVYHKTDETYMQIGIQDGVVVTAYIIGRSIDTTPFQIGQDISKIYAQVTTSPIVEVEIKGSGYQFEMSEEDMNIRPIVELDGIYFQLYVDHFTNTLSSIRIMNAETLVKHRPYAVVYRGELIVSKEKSSDELRAIEMAQARQIFDVTNVIRKRHHLKPLKWSDAVAKVAYGHSQDMEMNQYFSHDSPQHGTVGNRLTKGAVSFQLAGENIAAQYTDGLAAVEGWLNSEGHRKILLEEDFTHLGVGVYKKYYTQNFVKLNLQ